MIEIFRCNISKFVILLCIFLLLVSTIFIYYKQSFFYNNSEILQEKRNELIVLKLNDIRDAIFTIKNNPIITKKAGIDIQLEKNISDIQKSFTEVTKTSDILKISGQITAMNDKLDLQLGEVKNVITQQVAGKKEYLNIDILPFKIISIDVVGDQRYIIVNYLNQILPLTYGDTLGSWRVNQVDYNLQTAEFENEKKQYIRVNF